MSGSEKRHAQLERRAIREREEIENARKVNLAILAMTALTVVYFIYLIVSAVRQPIAERAAYLEGRYDLTPGEAMTLALAERNL